MQETTTKAPQEESTHPLDQLGDRIESLEAYSRSNRSLSDPLHSEVLPQVLDIVKTIQIYLDQIDQQTDQTAPTHPTPSTTLGAYIPIRYLVAKETEALLTKLIGLDPCPIPREEIEALWTLLQIDLIGEESAIRALSAMQPPHQPPQQKTEP